MQIYIASCSGNFMRFFFPISCYFLAEFDCIYSCALTAFSYIDNCYISVVVKYNKVPTTLCKTVIQKNCYTEKLLHRQTVIQTNSYTCMCTHVYMYVYILNLQQFPLCCFVRHN